MVFSAKGTTLKVTTVQFMRSLIVFSLSFLIRDKDLPICFLNPTALMYFKSNMIILFESKALLILYNPQTNRGPLFACDYVLGWGQQYVELGICMKHSLTCDLKNLHSRSL